MVELYNGKYSVNFTEIGHTYFAINNITKQQGYKLSVSKYTDMIPKDWKDAWIAKTTAKAINDKITCSFLDGSLNAKLIGKFCLDAQLQYKEIGQTAMTFGTKQHLWLEKYVKSIIIRTEEPPPPDTILAKNLLAQFKTWLTRNPHIRLISSERIVFSEILDYVGTLDLLTEEDDDIVVNDYKFANQLGISYFIQLAGYALALEEEIGRPIKIGRILRFDKKKQSLYQTYIKNLNPFKAIFKLLIPLRQFLDLEQELFTLEKIVL